MIFVNPLNCCTFAKRVVRQANLCITQKLELLPNHNYIKTQTAETFKNSKAST